MFGHSLILQSLGLYLACFSAPAGYIYSLASWLAAAALVTATGLPYSPCQLHIRYLYIYILGRVCRVHGQYAG